VHHWRKRRPSSTKKKKRFSAEVVNVSERRKVDILQGNSPQFGGERGLGKKKGGRLTPAQEKKYYSSRICRGKERRNKVAILNFNQRDQGGFFFKGG